MSEEVWEGEQPSLSWPWIAGFFDGEGSVSYYKSGPKGYPQTRISIASTDRFVLEAIQSFTGVGAILPQKKADGRHKQLWAWHVGKGSDVEAVLLGMLPHLVVQKDRALLLLEACKPMSPKRRDEIFEQLKILDKRGVQV